MSWIRRVVERLARGRKLKRTLPNGVPFYVSPDAQLKYLKRSFDDDLIQLANDHVDANSVVWDVGSNCGVFAFSAAKAKQVVAVEADPFLSHILQESIAINGLPVSLVSAAAWSSRGVAEFTIARRGRASNHLASVAGRSQSGGERARIMVPTLALDDMLETFMAPTFIKIDVEGAETEVLRGASKVLRECQPTVYLEIGEESFEGCSLLLKEAGYEMSNVGGMNWMCTPKKG